MSLQQAEFDFVRNLVRADSGIHLDASKEYLVEARLRSLAQEVRIESVQSFIEKLRTSPRDAMHRRVVEAMTTNETSFFRDLHPYESMRRTIVPALLEKRHIQRTLTIWSAACSTGQEPYTIAMLIRENFPQLAHWSCRIIASDLTRDVIARAKAGRYTQLEVNRGMPASYLVKYFTRDKLEWALKDEIRQMIEFMEINLIRPFPSLPKMDIICLRNVLIYFEVETKRTILEAIRRQLKPDGYLLLGNSEAAFGIHDGFERLPGDRSGWHSLRP